MIGLTRKQAELLSYIETYMATEPVAPSYEEMMRAVRLYSKSGVARLLKALEERSYIRRIPNRARAIELLHRNGLERFTDAELQAELDRRNHTLRAAA